MQREAGVREVEVASGEPSKSGGDGSPGAVLRNVNAANGGAEAFT